MTMSCEKSEFLRRERDMWVALYFSHVSLVLVPYASLLSHIWRGKWLRWPLWPTLCRRPSMSRPPSTWLYRQSWPQHGQAQIRGGFARVLLARARQGPTLPGRREAEGRPSQQGEEGSSRGELSLPRHQSACGQ